MGKRPDFTNKFGKQMPSTADAAKAKELAVRAKSALRWVSYPSYDDDGRMVRWALVDFKLAEVIKLACRRRPYCGGFMISLINEARRCPFIDVPLSVFDEAYIMNKEIDLRAACVEPRGCTTAKGRL